MLKQSKWQRAFTVAELFIVVGLLILLVLLMAPSLTRAREQGRSSVCLANLGHLGTALMQYAADDSKEQPIPIHRRMCTANSFWEWRTSQWFTWGGRSAIAPFIAGAGPSAPLWNFSDDPNVGGGCIPYPPQIPGGAYSAAQRPLNVYLSAGSGGDDQYLQWFHCPSDTGYPNEPEWVDDSPAGNANRPCWDTLGNSYRASLALLASVGAGGGSGSANSGMFSRGPWGHQLSTLADPGHLLLVAEPMLGVQIGLDDQWPPDSIAYAWHGVWMTQNALFCDGSARAVMTAPRQLGGLPEAEAEEVEGAVDPPPDPYPCVLGKYRCELPRFRLDCYPTPGALIWDRYNGPFRAQMQVSQCWPWAGAQDNFSN